MAACYPVKDAMFWLPAVTVKLPSRTDPLLTGRAWMHRAVYWRQCPFKWKERSDQPGRQRNTWTKRKTQGNIKTWPHWVTEQSQSVSMSCKCLSVGLRECNICVCTYITHTHGSENIKYRIWKFKSKYILICDYEMYTSRCLPYSL